MTPAVILACTWMVAWAPPPDLIPLGHRTTRHELVLEDHELFRTHQVLAGPVRGLHEWAVIEPGRPFRFSSKYGTRIFALPPDVPVPTRPPRWDRYPEDWPETFLVGTIPLHEMKSVPILSPVYEVRTTLRVVGVTGREIQLEVVDEVRSGRDGGRLGGGALAILPALSLAGLAGLLWLARRKPAASEESA